MKIDMSKLPVLEAVIGLLLVVLVITFVGAFAAVNNDEEIEEPGASATPAGTPAPDGSTLVVSMQDNSFDPDGYIVASGANVTFDITNDGNAVHNMHIAAPGGDYDSDAAVVSDPEQMSGGDTGTLAWQAPTQPGDIDFRCDFHPAQMTGVITVQ